VKTSRRYLVALALVCGLIEPSAGLAQPHAPAPKAGPHPTPTPTPTPTPNPTAEPEPAAALPPEHTPQISLELTPKSGIATGDIVHLTLRADALVGDDVTVPEQTFAPFEVRSKRARTEPAQNGKQRFVFDIDLIAFDPGELAVPAIELRVVTKDGFVGSVKTQAQPLKVTALLGNEPDAKLKPETKPVVVMQDDYRLLYVLGAILAAGLVALITWLTSRYLQRRMKPVPPPPPPRPPWEIAVEKLGELRRRKQRMVEEGKAAQFVDEVSDVVREYLGGRFGFDGLESTTDEMLALLRQHGANVGLWQEVSAYLQRCDLVKFAKVDPDQDEADLVFAKAQDIVQFSMPLEQRDNAPAAHTSGTPRASAPPKNPAGRNDGGAP
jgi:hypothetical protein